MSDIKEGYLRVTECLQKYNNFDKIPALVLHNASDRGTKVHRLAELHMLGEYFPEPDKELLGYLKSFQGWYDTMVSKLISTEERFYDDVLMLTGCVDIVAVLKGDKAPTIIDIKTPSTESKTWKLQLAMYRQLFNTQKDTKGKAERRIALKLDKNGKLPKIYEYTNHEQDLKLYMSALELHRYFQ
jgi:hypothetical protein